MMKINKYPLKKTKIKISLKNPLIISNSFKTKKYPIFTKQLKTILLLKNPKKINQNQ